MNRREILASTPAAILATAAQPGMAAEPGPIERLLVEYRRRSDILCADGFGNIEPHHVDWLDKPLHEAMEFMPDNPREFAALFVLIHLDDGFMAEHHARKMFDRCEALLA